MAFSLQILSDVIKLLLCVFRHDVTSNIIFVQKFSDLKICFIKLQVSSEASGINELFFYFIRRFGEYAPNRHNISVALDPHGMPK